MALIAVDSALARQLDVEAQHKARVTDITSIRAPEGFAYLSAAVDVVLQG